MANAVFRATNQDELAVLPVHDQSILIDEAVTSEDVLVLPMLIEHSMVQEDWMPEELPNAKLWRALYYSYRVPRRRAELRVANVVSCTLEDRTQIGSVDMNTLVCEGARFRINCIQDATIEAEVSALEVTLVVTDDVADHLRYRVVCGVHCVSRESG